eukprot:TRINITY_DN11999_c0_g1_i1.p1 TRINITY_DN11999_c0_g1~~TRINITY_DN11999_c0_g1_i1.p1  ORF type:complete len:149 (-),score=52.39 TRINITY_DN11999_c0_g1_i1:73-519(-)
MRGTIKAQRVLTAVKMINPAMVVPVARELWTRIWSLDKDITEDDSLIEALSACGYQQKWAESILEMTKQQSVKDKLREVTDRACEFGAFGAPFFIIHKPDIMDGESVDDEDEVDPVSTFFGSDRFALIANILRKPWFGPNPKKKSAKL